MASDAPSRPQLKVALDSNVLFDLAAGKDFAATVLEVLREVEALVYVPPTVLAELIYEVEHCVEPAKGELAGRALDALDRPWKLKAADLNAKQSGVAASFASALRLKGLVDFREVNDSRILGEATQIPAAYLLTSDKHLLTINRDKLHALFKEKDLPTVETIAPRRFFSLIKGK